MHNAHAIANAGSLGIALRQGGQVFVVFNAPSSSAKLTGSCYGNFAVTCAQIYQFVVWPHLCGFQQLEHQVIARWQPHDILAHLPSLGGIGFSLQHATSLQACDGQPKAKGQAQGA